MPAPESSIATSVETERAFQARWRSLGDARHDALFDRLIENEYRDEQDQSSRLIQALNRVLLQAMADVPFYREQGYAGLSSSPIAATADLARFPVLTRYDVLNNFARLTSRDRQFNSTNTSITSTSGSTGLPAKVLNTADNLGMFALLWQRQARWHRLDLSKRFARIRIAGDLFRQPDGAPLREGQTARNPRWLHSGKFFQTGDEIHFTNNNPRPTQIEWLQLNSPAYLMTYPGLLEEIVLANDCAAIPGLDACIVVSSMLTEAMAARIRNALGIPVHRNYGLNEVGIVAVMCSAGRYHVNTEHACVEIVDDGGNPVAAGESGRLLVSTLNNPAMPLVRYDSGDLATASAGACPCGRSLPSFENILGRHIRFAGTPPQTRPRLNGLLGVLSGMPNEMFRNIRRYQIFQNRDADFEMRLVTTGPVHEEFEPRLQENWRQTNGEDGWRLTIVRVEELVRTPSGKELDFYSAFQESVPEYYNDGSGKQDQS
ncbi:MAG: hypothetical protein RL120_03575 [Gammaproteobacteria bacterium]